MVPYSGRVTLLGLRGALVGGPFLARGVVDLREVQGAPGPPRWRGTLTVVEMASDPPNWRLPTGKKRSQRGLLRTGRYEMVLDDRQDRPRVTAWIQPRWRGFELTGPEDLPVDPVDGP